MARASRRGGKHTQMNAWVYMLRCADGSYYIGSARGSLDHRLGQHQSGELGGYTSSRRPVTLVWSTDFHFITDAIAFERQVKGWSRSKKEALIHGDYAALSKLASRKASFETAASRPPEDEESGGSSKRRPEGAPQDEKKKVLLTLVVAVAENGVIGNKGALPWRIPEDLKR